MGPGPISVPADVWADVKTPGDGRTYAVGTTMVVDTQATSSPTFSLVNGVPRAIQSPPGVAAVFGGLRQVVVLQCSDTTSIPWQTYYHGQTPNQPVGNGLSTNARAISVFPGATDAETRIAICGETHDATLPLGQASNNQFLNTQTSGFIAVYDGASNLLWSHLFFGGNSAGQCTITDVSIRVEGVAPNQTDVVTFCGASAFGNAPPTPPSTSSIQTVLPFTIPPTPSPCAGDNPANGSTDNGAGEWDGIVGRLTRAHSGAGATSLTFLSVVGGREQDALFGLAEIDAHRFVVVGTTTRTPRQPYSSPFTFPVLGDCIANTNEQAMGTITVFDAAPTRTGNSLVLVASRLIGPNRSNPTIDVSGETCARDVVVQGEWIWVVGSTSDAGLPTALGFDPVFDGPTEGFALTTTIPYLQGQFPDGYFQMSYFGGAGEDGLMGISAWNEYADHVVVTGFTGSQAARDLVAASIWMDTAGSRAPSVPQLSLERIRQHTLTAAGSELPATMGGTHALNQSPLYLEGILRSAGGGGISVDQTFRTSIVGSTNAGVPVIGTGNPYTTGLDCVRVVLDMLPPNVCRTDGTGQCPGSPVPQGVGSTTPTCALAPFGKLITLPSQPAAPLDRILIDFLGTNVPGSTDVALIMDRPPSSYQNAGTFLQFGFISTPPMTVSGVELWTQNNPVLFQHFPGPGQSVFFKINTLPSTPGAVTAQFVSLLSSNLSCTGSQLVASPALTFVW